MKLRAKQLMGVVIATCIVGEVQAQRRPEKPAKPHLKGELGELGRTGDEVMAWKVAAIGGAEYFTKEQDELREKYREVETQIRDAVLEDRLAESAGRNFIVELMNIGKGAKNDTQATESALDDLSASVKAATSDDVVQGMITPRLNKMQWMMNEVALYGAYTKEVSTGRVSSLRRKLVSLEGKEQSAKKDKKVSDRERESLEKKALDIWKGVVKSLKED